MNKPFPERRKYKRIKFPFTAKVRIQEESNGTIRSKESSKWELVTIRNLSAGGISFNHTKKIELDTVLELNLSLPFITEPVHCLGKVCRVDEKPTDKKQITKIPVYGIAAYFIQMEDDKKQAIDGYVKKLSSGE